LKKHPLITVFGMLALVLLACNLSNKIATTPTETAEEPAMNIPTSLPEDTATPTQVPETPVSFQDAQTGGQACLNGTWTINNLSTYVTEAIPPDLADQYNLKYKDTSGSAILTLTPDGRISLRFDQLIFQFDASVSIFSVPLTVGIDGEARGEYALNGNLLTTSQMDTSGLSASAVAMGQDVIDPAQIISLIPLVEPPFNTAVYTCAGDTLQLEFPAYPEDFPPLVFQRVK
jgi:hypothetical protein